MFFANEVKAVQLYHLPDCLIIARQIQKSIGIQNCTANGFAEMEPGRESRRSKCLENILKYWYGVMFLETEEAIKQCYEWQICNMGVKS
jgi:hypothetical protein